MRGAGFGPPTAAHPGNLLSLGVQPGYAVPPTTAKGFPDMMPSIISRCEAQGLRLTGQRRVIAAVLEKADDHPDVEELHSRATQVDPGISIATVYRTVKLFEEAGIIEKHDFGDGRARYESADRDHHDHLIDIVTGEVIEFVDPEIEVLQEKIARRLGYQIVDHRLELYARKLPEE